jgi:hypothetical protein
MAVNEPTPQSRPITTTSLVDLLDRVIGGGAAVSGDIIIALAGIDLVRLDLRLVLAPVGGSVGEPRNRR